MFGGKKEAPPPPPSLNEATETVNKRVGVLDDKIKQLDKQLIDFKNQMKNSRPGPAQNRIKQRAMQVLKKKRMYENQRDQLGGMAWNMEQADFAQQNVATAINTAAAMKGGVAALKDQMKAVDLSEIEDGVDDMAELLEEVEEINTAMSRSYGVDDEIDMAELEDELAALDEQIALEEESSASEVPAYLQDDATEPATVVPATPAATTGEQVDEFGLPIAAS